MPSQTLDEWCIPNVAIRYRWWYHDCLAFLIDGALGVPNDSLGNLGSYHELASMFMKIGGAAFGLMLPVFAGYVAYSIAEKPGLVAGFVAVLLLRRFCLW